MTSTQTTTSTPTTATGKATADKTAGPYPMNTDNLSPSVRAMDMIAHYLGERAMAGDPISTAFAAVFAIEGAGLRIIDPNADVKEPG